MPPNLTTEVVGDFLSKGTLEVVIRNDGDDVAVGPTIAASAPRQTDGDVQLDFEMQHPERAIPDLQPTESHRLSLICPGAFGYPVTFHLRCKDKLGAGHTFTTES